MFKNCIDLDLKKMHILEHLYMMSCCVYESNKNLFDCKHEFLSVVSIFIEFFKYKQESAQLVDKYPVLLF
jgi:hypothetical protein